MSQFRNLVFEGGGVKGIAYVGAMEVLEARGILADIERVGGTSAGAINAVLFACGFTNAQQKRILRGLDFKKFMDDSPGVLRDINRLVDEFGWHKGEFFKDWIGGLIEQKMGIAKATFADFRAAGRPDLYLYGADLNTGFGRVYSPEHTPQKKVLNAVRISMSLPLFFKAVRGDKDHVMVDGGLLNNYPVRLFDRQKYIAADAPKAAQPTDYYEAENKAFLKGANKNRSPYVYNRQTLGFRVDSRQEIAAFRHGRVRAVRKVDDFVDYAKALVLTALNAQESMHLESDDWQRTVYIDAKGVGTADFGLSDAKKTKLVTSGRESTEKYFDWFETARGKQRPVNRV